MNYKLNKYKKADSFVSPFSSKDKMQKQNAVTLALRCKWAMGRAPGYCSNDVVLSQVM